jgi:hypothetical protein
MSLMPLLALLCASAVDPRIEDAQRLAAHGDVDAALAGYVAVYDELSASGVATSAGLHKNIGSLALTKGDLGRAALHLQAAARRAPHDDDVAFNLRLLREARADQVSATSLTHVGAAVPPRGARLGVGAALALLGVVLALRGAFGSRVPVVVVAGAVAAVVVAGAVAGARVAFEHTRTFVVVKDTVARGAPDDAATGFDVHTGLSGVFVDDAGPWRKLRLENDVVAFLAVDDVAEVP